MSHRKQLRTLKIRRKMAFREHSWWDVLDMYLESLRNTRVNQPEEDYSDVGGMTLDEFQIWSDEIIAGITA